jgi:hypothetical protein
MNTDTFHRNSMKTGRSMTPLLILVACITMVLAGPLFCGKSLTWAQLDSSRQSAFRLVGTIEGGPFTGAVIDDTKNPQAFYRLNDKLPDDSQIVKVQNNHIVLKWPDGTKGELYTTPGAGSGSVSAVPAVAPYAAPRQAGQSTPERSVDPAGGTAQGPTPSPGSEEGSAASRRAAHARLDRQNPNQQSGQVQDPNTRTGGYKGKRNRTRSVAVDD